MNSHDMMQELATLRAEVESLQQQQAAGVTPANSVQESDVAESTAVQPEPAQEPTQESLDSSAEDVSEQFESKLHELYDLVEKDFKDMPALPAVTLLCAGILVGRMMG